MNKIYFVLIIASIMTGCATGTGGFNSAQKTNQLRPGMTTEEVTGILGDPAYSRFDSGFLVWKYSLQKPWVGWIPFYLAFGGEEMVLVGWQENMQEYYATQSLWLQTLPQQHNVNVDATIEHNVNGNINHSISQ